MRNPLKEAFEALEKPPPRVDRYVIALDEDRKPFFLPLEDADFDGPGYAAGFEVRHPKGTSLVVTIDGEQHEIRQETN